MVRTNISRDHLKTEYRTRYIALQPQLAEIMGEYLKCAQAPAGRLLFPGAAPDEPVGDWRKSLDEIAALAGLEPGEVRTRRFRPTFATHRAYMCDKTGQPMSTLKLRAEMGHGSMEMLSSTRASGARDRTWSTAGASGRRRTGSGSVAESRRRSRWARPGRCPCWPALDLCPTNQWMLRLGMRPGRSTRRAQLELVVCREEERGSRGS